MPDDLRRLSQDLGRVAVRAVPEVDAVLKRGAQNLKNDYNADAATSDHFSGKRRRSLDSSWSYDQLPGVGRIAYEVGPDKGRGGSIANIAYFGGSRGGGTLDIEAPMQREEPNLLRELERFAEGLMR